jgi:hypothetical protein
MQTMNPAIVTHLQLCVGSNNPTSALPVAGGAVREPSETLLYRTEAAAEMRAPQGESRKGSGEVGVVSRSGGGSAAPEPPPEAPGQSRKQDNGVGDPKGDADVDLVPPDAIERFGALTVNERRLVRRLSQRRKAAEAVVTALFHAEKAAAAAMEATGAPRPSTFIKYLSPLGVFRVFGLKMGDFSAVLCRKGRG